MVDKHYFHKTIYSPDMAWSTRSFSDVYAYDKLFIFYTEKILYIFISQ